MFGSQANAELIHEAAVVIARRIVLVQLILTLLLAGCATHEFALSGKLRPASSTVADLHLTLFRARVQMDRLEVWGRLSRSDSDYRRDFDTEISSTAALCAMLANSGLIFESKWRSLELRLTVEYGSQLRWKAAHGHTIVSISRNTLLELRRNNAPASAYPSHWHLFAYKAGPPDYVPYEWSPAEGKGAAGGQDGG